MVQGRGFSKKTSIRLRLVVLVVLLVSSYGLPVYLRAADTAEYLKVERPVVIPLAQVPSPTDGIGYSPDSWIRNRGLFSLLPYQVLPRVWDQYIPLTGQPFIDDIIFSVSPRFYYFYRDTENSGISESAAYGGAMEMETGWWRDLLRLNIAAYTSQKLYGPEDRDGSTSLREGQQAYTVLGEMSAEIKLGEFKARAGRTRIDLPYLNAYDIRMTPNTFEGAGFSLHSVKKLQIGAGHLTKIKTRNSSSFESMSQQAGVEGVDRGVSFVGLRYDLPKGSDIGIVDEYAWDLYNTVYVEAKHLLDLSDELSVRLSAQFTDQRSVGEALLGSFATQSGGVKAAMGLEDWSVSAALVATSRAADVRSPWGGSPTFRSSLISDLDRAGESAFKLGLAYGFDRWGLKGGAADLGYLYANTPDGGNRASPDEREFSFTLDYRPKVKVIDKFWLRFRYAINDADASLGGADREDFRVILNYSYDF